MIAEVERLSYGHTASPTFATETSRIEPLPHQRIAVYEHMLSQPRLRFLLADDAGAGKTIMSGLYIREMQARRLIRRVLIVPPAGLIGNWERELRTLFGLRFHIVRGADAKSGNPFAGDAGSCVICSVDTLSGASMFAKLQSREVDPYEVVILDEAHKLAASRDADLTVRKTDRYQLAEALAGVMVTDPQWALPWSANHLLLLTATPHMGRTSRTTRSGDCSNRRFYRQRMRFGPSPPKNGESALSAEPKRRWCGSMAHPYTRNGSPTP